MLSPKKVKWRRAHRPRTKGLAKRGSNITYGDYGLISTGSGRLTARQIEAARIAISRSVKRGGKLWLRIFPDLPVTKKPAEVRMGGGKGAVEYWAALIKPGRVLFEINGVTEEQAREAFTRASHKLPMKTKFLRREDMA